MREYIIKDSSNGQEATLSLLRLTDATDFDPKEFDAIASMLVGDTKVLGEISIERVQ
jgi:hypothetical protein